MKTAQLLGTLFTFATAAVVWVIASIHVLRPRYLRWRLRRDDRALAAVEDDLERTHILFGRSVKLRSKKSPDGTLSIELTCRSCAQWNRITRGFVNAVCGKCKVPLTALNDKNEQRAVN